MAVYRVSNVWVTLGHTHVSVCTTPPSVLGTNTNAASIAYVDPTGHTPPNQGGTIPIGGVATVNCQK